MYIGGQSVKSVDPRPVRLPYDGSEVGTIYQTTKEQVDAAIAAAAAAAPVMREMTLDERAAILRKTYYRLLERRDEMAMAVCSETGKPIKEARLEVECSAMTLLFSSEEAHRLHGEVVPMDASPACKGHWAMTVREPFGWWRAPTCTARSPLEEVIPSRDRSRWGLEAAQGLVHRDLKYGGTPGGAGGLAGILNLLLRPHFGVRIVCGVDLIFNYARRHAQWHQFLRRRSKVQNASIAHRAACPKFPRRQPFQVTNSPSAVIRSRSR
jgi:RNA polymerase-binding transcription factor DksA